MSKQNRHATVLLECVNPKCKKQYSPIGGRVLRWCECGNELRPVEKKHRPPEKKP